MLNSTALLHSEQLTQHIRQEIEKSQGAISFARFMELALYTPGLGYYSAGAHKLGKGGDFITAPEISPLFARCIANQFKQIFNETIEKNILEIGAGSGIFAKTILQEIQLDHYFILEISADLRERQQQFLKTTCPDLFDRITWLDTLPAEFSGVIFANEVMDAMPVHSFFIDNDKKIKEYFVAWENHPKKNNYFIWDLKNATPALERFVLSLQHHIDIDFNPHYRSEANLMLPAWIQALAECLKKGVMILIDYGYGRREYYHPDRNQGTLMCFYQHRRHTNPLQYIGLQDITAHVDFTTVAESAVDAHLSVAGFTTQASFLLSCGLTELADNSKLSAQEIYQQSQGIKTLILPAQMGEVVKVMALTKNFSAPLLGFGLQDLRRDL